METKNFTKTGTTCIGLIYKDGVILATDRRITAGYIVSDDFKKLDIISKRVAATWSGLLADAQLYSRVIKAEVKLKEFTYERELSVKEVAMIANNIQYNHVRTPTPIEPIVGYIIGGYDDEKGAQLYEIGPEGSLKEYSDFASNGSGSYFIKTLLKENYKPGLSEKDAIKLVEKALTSAMKIDTASGGGIVMYIITKDGIKELTKKKIKEELVNEK